MVMAHRTLNPAIIAHTAAVVVVADLVFTATAVVLQPVTGVALAVGLGWRLSEGWIVQSVALYILIGILWLPVVFIQLRLRDEARFALREGRGLADRYRRLFRIWFACGVPAFAAILVILWLMVTREPVGS